MVRAGYPPDLKDAAVQNVLLGGMGGVSKKLARPAVEVSANNLARPR